MRLIDADSHFIEPSGWFRDVDPDLDRDLPWVGEMSSALFPFGELIDSLPEAVSAGCERMLPPKLLRRLKRVADLSGEEWRPEVRIAKLDSLGIEIQFLNPGSGSDGICAEARRRGSDSVQRVIDAYNRWCTEVLSGFTDRLIPVSQTDLRDLDWAVTQLEAVRRRGCRVVRIDPTPLGDVSIAHPDVDRFWSACLDLGVIPTFHIGGGRPTFDPGWVNGGGTLGDLVMLGYSQVKQVPEIALTAMIIGGVFERLPDLRVLVAEFGVSWVPGWLDQLRWLEELRIVSIHSGGWRLPLAAVEYARRNVLFTPLANDAIVTLLDVAPEMLVFSTDYPHPEGCVRGVEHYSEVFAGRLDRQQQAAFFGQTVQDLLDAGA